MSNNEITIICQGCENECEISIAFKDGKVVCLGGNNCPTGESFSLAQANREKGKGHRNTQNNDMAVP